MPIYKICDVQPRIMDRERTWIAPNAFILGNVTLEPLTSVWFGAVLRGDNDHIHVGDGTNIQDNAVVHVDERRPVAIGKNCTIGHRVILHGCTIGDNSLIGMGATVMNGARIGANSLVGAASLVTENKKYPDNVLIMGSPARVVRPLTVEERTKITEAALHYQQKIATFNEKLQLVSG